MRTNSLGTFTPWQNSSNALSAKPLNRNTMETSNPKSMSGAKILSYATPGVKKFLYKVVAAKIQDMLVPDGKHLARTLVAQQKSVENCCKLGSTSFTRPFRSSSHGAAT